MRYFIYDEFGEQISNQGFDSIGEAHRWLVDNPVYIPIGEDGEEAEGFYLSEVEASKFGTPTKASLDRFGIYPQFDIEEPEETATRHLYDFETLPIVLVHPYNVTPADFNVVIMELDSEGALSMTPVPANAPQVNEKGSPSMQLLWRLLLEANYHWVAFTTRAPIYDFLPDHTVDWHNKS